MSNTIEAKPTNASDMVDIQSSRDNRAIHIDKVGIKDIRHPIQVKDRSGHVQHAVANFNMYVDLPHDFNDLAYGTKTLNNGNRVADGQLMGWIYKLKSIEDSGPMIAFFRDIMMLDGNTDKPIAINKTVAAINYWLQNERSDLPMAVTEMSFKSYNTPVAEDGTLTDNGALTITDVDASDNPVSWNDEGPAAGDNGYGTFQMVGNTWTYTLNNGLAAVQALDAGETLSDTYTFTASDASTQLVSVTINGAEDAPLIGGDTAGAVDGKSVV